MAVRISWTNSLFARSSFGQRKGGININKGDILPTYEVIYLIAKLDFQLAPKA